MKPPRLPRSSTYLERQLATTLRVASDRIAMLESDLSSVRGELHNTKTMLRTAIIRADTYRSDVRIWQLVAATVVLVTIVIIVMATA